MFSTICTDCFLPLSARCVEMKTQGLWDNYLQEQLLPRQGLYYMYLLERPLLELLTWCHCALSGFTTWSKGSWTQTPNIWPYMSKTYFNFISFTTIITVLGTLTILNQRQPALPPVDFKSFSALKKHQWHCYLSREHLTCSTYTKGPTTKYCFTAFKDRSLVYDTLSTTEIIENIWKSTVFHF